MFFWIISILLIAVVCVLLLQPLLRDRGGDAPNSDVALYKAQLAEVERDLTRGLLDAEEGEAAKAEVARRLLAANRAGTDSFSQGPTTVLAAATVAVLMGVTGIAYLSIGAPGEADQPLAERLAQADEMRLNRPSQAALEAAAPPLPEVDAPAEYLASVEQLREIVPNRPDDLRGWELLAFHEAELRQYPAAIRAQARVIELKGEAATAEDLGTLLDLLVAAANGYVSPEAETVIQRILNMEPAHIGARYYLGALYYQTARPDLALRIWRPLVGSGQDTFHIALARMQIEDAAARAGVDYTLPAQAVGPSAEDIEAAQDMTEEDRQAMIVGMVTRLSDRLANEGGTAEDWARLIGAYGVLGRTEAAAAVWGEAQEVFAADPTAMEALRAAAQSAGVAE